MWRIHESLLSTALYVSPHFLIALLSFPRYYTSLDLALKFRWSLQKCKMGISVYMGALLNVISIFW